MGSRCFHRGRGRGRRSYQINQDSKMTTTEDIILFFVPNKPVPGGFETLRDGSCCGLGGHRRADDPQNYNSRQCSLLPTPGQPIPRVDGKSPAAIAGGHAPAFNIAWVKQSASKNHIPRQAVSSTAGEELPLPHLLPCRSRALQADSAVHTSQVRLGGFWRTDGHST
jgi:hypothetical protein